MGHCMLFFRLPPASYLLQDVSLPPNQDIPAMMATPTCDPLFKVPVEGLDTDTRIALSYARARRLLEKHTPTAADVANCTPKFWALASDPATPLDMACYTILTIQLNLVVGSLAKHATYRNDLETILERLLRLDMIGLFLLTERGHGVDSFNVETTATMNDHGFVLDTPREEAAKFMPASSPFFSIPKIALVWAKLIVSGEDRGGRFFLVPICDEKEMCKGVSSTRLPPRSGTSPLDFSITTFDNVQLPHSALLDISLNLPADPLGAWWDAIWRVPIGSAAVALPLIQAIKHTAYIGSSYSLHRHIVGKGPIPVPIFAFRTQQWPMLQAIAVSLVLDVWKDVATRQIADTTLDGQVRHGYSVIFKATVCRFFQICIREVAERCGAQGTFEHNFMSRIEADARGVIIADGDTLSVSIRLFNELLLKRYTIPIPSIPQSLLHLHAHGVFEDNRNIMQGVPGGHRNEAVNALLLPQAEPSVIAIGLALAYSAAVDAGLPKPIIDLFECSAIRQHTVWYSESANLSSFEQREREEMAVTGALPHVQDYLEMLGIQEYATAPIVSDAAWKKYLASLPVVTGNAVGRRVLEHERPTSAAVLARL